MTKPQRKLPPKLPLVFASHLLLFFALGCLFYHLVPRFDASFHEWQIKINSHTAFVLGISRWLMSYWYLAILLIIPYYFLLKWIKRLDEKRPGLLTFWTLFIWYAGASFLVFTAYCLITSFPELTGMTGLSK